MKFFFKINISVFILFLLTNSVFSQFKVLDDLKKTGDQILKETGSGQGTNINPKSPSSQPPASVQNKEDISQQQTKSSLPEGQYGVDCFFNNIEGQRGLENINRIYLFDEKKAKWTLLLSRNDGVTGDLGKKLDVMNLNNVIMSSFFVKKEGNPNTFIYQADLYNFSYIDYVKIDFNKATAQLTRVLKRDTSLKKVYDVVCRKI
jgi:hypothetical protein